MGKKGFNIGEDGRSLPRLEIGRAYTAEETAAFFGISKSALNDRVREGFLKPVFERGDRRFSGYDIARRLGWSLSDNPWEDRSQTIRESVQKLMAALNASEEARRQALAEFLAELQEGVSRDFESPDSWQLPK